MTGKRKKRLGRTLLLFLVFPLFLLGLFSSGEAVVDRIVAVVNQEVITLSEVEKWVNPLQEEEIKAKDRLTRQERIRELRQSVLEKLIEEKLIDQEAKKWGIKVSGKEVEAALDDIKRRNSLAQEDLEKLLAKEGLTIEAYKKQIATKLQNIKLINAAVKVELKDEEKKWREFYQNNIARYQSPLSYRPSHILFVIPKEATPEEIQEIKKKCQDVLEKIKNGEDFGDMALLYSGDASRKDRGDLGYFKKGELLPALEKELLRLKVGEVGRIVRTDFGFHLIKLLEQQGGSLPYEEVKEKVKADYFDKEMETAIKQFIGTLKEKSTIEIKL